MCYTAILSIAAFFRDSFAFISAIVTESVPYISLRTLEHRHLVLYRFPVGARVAVGHKAICFCLYFLDSRSKDIGMSLGVDL